MLFFSYAAAIGAVCAATAYLVLRLRWITTTTMLMGSLLLVYGPAYLSFTLSSGQHAFLLRLFGMHVEDQSAFAMIREKVPDIDGVITSMNFSIALMYAGIIAGIEIVGRLAPARSVTTSLALHGWTTQPLQDDPGNHRLLSAAIILICAFMVYISITEQHIRIVTDFFAIKADDGARNLFRARFSGSHSYIYRVTLSAVAPMFVIWGLLAGLTRRSWLLLFAAALLLLATMLGKMEQLSKAPQAFFLLQLLLAALLALTNRLSGRIVFVSACVVAILIYATTFLIISGDRSILEMAYSRVFEIENETLLQNFGRLPASASLHVGHQYSSRRSADGRALCSELQPGRQHLVRQS